MGTEPLANRTLVELYYRYVGEPERMRDIYGYWLFLIGSLAGVFGVLTYQLEQALVPGHFGLRETAIIAAALGLAIALFGIVVLLPVRRRGIIASLVGLLIAFLGVGLFSQNYPHAWYVGPDYSAEIIAVYGAGITIIAAVAVLVPIITGERGLLVEPELGLGSDEPPILLGNATRDAFYAVYETPTNEWAWRMIQREAMAEGASIAASDTDARLLVEDVRETVGEAGLLDLTTSSFRIYRTSEDRWRWSLVRQDGGVVAESPRTAASRDEVESTASFLKDHAPHAEQVEIRGAAWDIRQNDAERWSWRLIDDQRTTIAQSVETTNSAADAEARVDTFVSRLEDARVVALESIGFELFQDPSGWRWRIATTSDERLATSEHAYENRHSAELAAERVVDHAAAASIIDGGVDRFEVVTEADGWTWRLRNEGADVLVEQPEVVTEQQAARAAAERTRDALMNASPIEYAGADFEIYPEEDDDWRWRLVSAEREVLAESTERFETREETEAAADRVRERALAAELLEFDEAAFQQYESNGEWRWRLIDADGRVMADSGQEYGSQEAVRQGMLTLKEHAPEADVLDVETAAFEIYRAETGEYTWRLIDEGGRLIAEAAGSFSDRTAARDAVQFLTDHVSAADIREMRDPAIQLYADGDDWSSRLIDVDGTTLARTVSPAATRDDAQQLAAEIRSTGSDAPIDVLGDITVIRHNGAGWHWSLMRPDHTPIATSDRTYESREQADEAIRVFLDGVAEAPTFEVGDGVVWVGRGADGWTWRLIDTDRTVYGAAGSTADSLPATLDAIDVVKRHAGAAGSFEIDTLAYEVFVDDGAWQWRLLDEEETVVAVSAAEYESREDARAAIADAREPVASASILEINEAAFEFHERDGGWVWRLIDEHGAGIAESVEVHPDRQAARESMLSAKEFGPSGEVTVTW